MKSGSWLLGLGLEVLDELLPLLSLLEGPTDRLEGRENLFLDLEIGVIQELEEGLDALSGRRLRQDINGLKAHLLVGVLKPAHEERHRVGMEGKLPHGCLPYLGIGVFQGFLDGLELALSIALLDHFG